MQLEVKSLLYDMRQSCDLILNFTRGKGFSDYAEDAACRSAVERQFIIIGEAMNRMCKTFPDIAARIPHHRTIINFRNILVHGYDRVEDEVVWGIVKSHLPEFQKALNMLFGEGDK